ncbi:ucp3 [Acrasis kona]|uniref:Ucp3 n=1 Tax=Acrasis kona TaxID=1008807 RepID=A0AAW2Z4D6_9EUKA
MKISLKITINNIRKRRLLVERTITFEALDKLVKEVLLTQDDLHWRYIDEENELIDISSNTEWLLAVQSHPSPSTMRLFVDQYPKPSQHQTTSGPRDGCSPLTKYLLPVALIWGTLYHPMIMALCVAFITFFTFHHYPLLFNILADHAKKHYNKVGLLCAATVLFNCKLCTLFLLLPIIVLAYKRAKDAIKRNKHVILEEAQSIIKQANNAVAEVNTIIKNTTEQIITNAIVRANEAPKPTVASRKEGPKVPTEEDLNFTLPVRCEEQFRTNLSTLTDLGFTNEKLNIHLLRTFNGDVDRVVKSLLNLSSCN